MNLRTYLHMYIVYSLPICVCVHISLCVVCICTCTCLCVLCVYTCTCRWVYVHFLCVFPYMFICHVCVQYSQLGYNVVVVIDRSKHLLLLPAGGVKNKLYLHKQQISCNYIFNKNKFVFTSNKLIVIKILNIHRHTIKN